MLTIQTCIDVNVPVQTAYDRWRQFEKFPQFMKGVKQGKHINTYRLYWNAEIADKRVVTFQPISDVMSTVVLQLAYTHEGAVEHVGDGVEVLSVRVRKELEQFKAFVESCSEETGNWLNSLPYHAFF